MRLNPRPARSSTAVVNYSDMDISTERVSPTRKRKTANLMRYPSAVVISAHKRMKNNVTSNITNIKQPVAENETNKHPLERGQEITSDNNVVETIITKSDTSTVTKDTTKSDNIIGTNRNNDIPKVTQENTDCDNNGIKSDNLKDAHHTMTSSTIPENNSTNPTPPKDAPELTTGTDTNTATTSIEHPPEITTEMTPKTAVTSEATKQQNWNMTTTTNSAMEPRTDKTDTMVQPDPLQGKTTPEKIAIETLLNIHDSMEFDDPDLEENALLMPVDRPPDIPIEPKGDIPTQPVNPEIPPETETRLDTSPPLEGNDTDTTENN